MVPPLQKSRVVVQSPVMYTAIQLLAVPCTLREEIFGYAATHPAAAWYAGNFVRCHEHRCRWWLSEEHAFVRGSGACAVVRTFLRPFDSRYHVCPVFVLYTPSIGVCTSIAE